MASAAEIEAKGLLRLLKQGETIPSLRKLIGNASPERATILAAFDALLTQRGIRFTKRPTPQPTHKRRHWTRENPVQDSSVQRRYGRRQRRFTFAERAAIEAAIKAGLRPGEIRRQFFMSEDSLLKFRRRMGVYRDCRYKPQVPDEVRAKVLELLPAYSVARTAAQVGVSRCRVLAIAATVGGAAALKTAGRGRQVGHELRNQILASLEAGTHPPEVCRQFRVSMDTVRKLRRTLGDVRDRRRDRKLNDVQVQEIRAALAGHTMTWRTLAREFGCGLTTIGSIYRHERGY